MCGWVGGCVRAWVRACMSLSLSRRDIRAKYRPSSQKYNPPHCSLHTRKELGENEVERTGKAEIIGIGLLSPKHAKRYSELFHASNRKPSIALGSELRGP